MSAATSGAVSGAAQGFAVGGVYGAVIGGVLGFVSGSAQDKQQESRQKWLIYNNEVQHEAALHNLEMGRALAHFNISSMILQGEIDSEIARRNANYNAGVILATAIYNNSLLENEIAETWKDVDLDLNQVKLFRDRERGQIVADQAASGTVIGEGSNAEVVISQETMRALDIEVIKYGANRQVAAIHNEMAKSLWEGDVAISQTMWEGSLASHRAQTNAVFGATSTMAETELRFSSGTLSAEHAYLMGEAGIELDASAFATQNTQNMINGLFSAAGTYGSGQLNNSSYGSTSSGGGGVASSGGGYGGTVTGRRSIYNGSGGLNGAGSSLAVG